ILAKSKCVFAPSKKIESLLQKEGNETLLIPNSVNIEDFIRNNKTIPSDIKDIPNPLAGFYDAVNEYVDLELLKFLALENPEINFIIIGPVFEDITFLKEIKNIHFTGAKPYSVLTDYLSAIEVWLVPFKQNLFLEKLNPVKVYEYLAANRTVISTY